MNFQPFQKQIKVSTKFHNFKPQEMNYFFSAAGGRRWPSLTPLWPPRVTPGSPRSDPGSTPSVFRPQRHLCFGFPTREAPCLWIFAGYIDTVSIQYRYCIDIACKNPKTGCLSGRRTEAQVPLGSENRSTGELRGRSWVASGGSWGDSGGSEGGQPNFCFFISWGLKLWNFVKTLICFWSGWKLIKINFSVDFFWKLI